MFCVLIQLAQMSGRVQHALAHTHTIVPEVLPERAKPDLTTRTSIRFFPGGAKAPQTPPWIFPRGAPPPQTRQIPPSAIRLNGTKISWKSIRRVNAIANVHEPALLYVHTYVRKYVRTYIRTYVRTYVCTYVCTYVRTYVRT
jgi:hypothetical protein